MRKRDPDAEADLSQLTKVFRSLSDKTRLNILLLLTHGEQNVTNLCRELALPGVTVSHHLGLLRMSHLIANRRNGKEVFYGLCDADDHEDDLLRLGVGGFTVRIISKKIPKQHHKTSR